jgi:release factor glutamine methyltransferase
MSNAQEPWTVRRLLDWTKDYFKQKGFPNSLVEAQILLAHTMGCTRIDLYTRTQEEAKDEVRNKFKELIKKRVEGCPVAYLVGYREFHLLTFEVSPAVLIPRPETELLVEQPTNLIKSKPYARVLDIGTGSGNIAISLAHVNKSIQVTAIDKSLEALEIAKRNATKQGVGDRVRFLQGDLFSPIGENDKFDLIVSNPPYIAHSEFDSLQVDVKNYEPRQALDGGSDGLDFYRKIVPNAKNYLVPNGWLLVEIGFTQEPAVRQIFEANGFVDIKMLRDIAKLPRVIMGRSPSV